MNAVFAQHDDKSHRNALVHLWTCADLRQHVGRGVPNIEEHKDFLSQWEAGHACVWLLFDEAGEPAAWVLAWEGDEPKLLYAHTGATRNVRGKLMAAFGKAVKGHAELMLSGFTVEAEVVRDNVGANAFARLMGFDEVPSADPDTIKYRRVL